MDSLVAIGSGAGYVYGLATLFRLAFALGAPERDWSLIMAFGMNVYLDSSAMIVVLITFGKWLEARAKGRTGDAIDRLMALAPATATVTLSGGFTPPRSGDAVYDPDALYWLSRIISAESRGEPLAGQIAVGNVILNRVRSTAFPNTIWGVIFDRKDGVQFTPVANGTVYASPYWISTVAAKICLEGYSVSTSALFFYEPSKATSYWIENNRPYLFTVGHHRFFS